MPKNILIYFYLFLCIVGQVAAQIFGRYAALTIGSLSIYQFIVNPYIYATFFSLSFQALFWQLSLKKIPLVTAYFAMSFIYPILMLSSVYIFNEKFTLPHLMGSSVITVGVFLFTKEISVK